MPTPEPDRIRLVTNLRAARRARGLTPAQLAEASAIDDADLIDIVNCDRLPSAIELARLADALGTTPEQLLGQPDPRPQFTACARRTPAETGPGRPADRSTTVADHAEEATP